ncbi:hypothetical protein D915_010908 [Fasciola hepatica]|uniref:Uncharacterized protein n=1 Tax=Fasciola hepatica TaxID=6192 RepID=A0A4E0QUC8_FASHE|nr:hypothetical protein D915_010908 [Fasciola hepatica]
MSFCPWIRNSNWVTLDVMRTFKIDTNFSDVCLSTSATNFNQMIQKGLNMEQCSKKELRKLMPNSRLFTHWFPGLPSFRVHVHIWLNGSEQKNVEENIENLFTECIDNLERATVLRVDLRGSLEIQCQPSDRDKEFIIPCSNEDEQNSSFPVSSAWITRLSETISEGTTSKYNSATWNRKFLIWMILSFFMLC